MHPEIPHNYAKHDIVPCSLCDETFICLCNRATECPCAQINITRDEAEWIGWQTNQECVCIKCLLSLRTQARERLEMPFTATSPVAPA